MKFVRSLALTTAVLGLAGVGHTQSLVLGDGLARQCYVDTVSGNPGKARAISRCKAALKNVSLSKLNRASTWVNLGILQMRSGDYERSMQSYDKSLTIAPDSPEALINRGAALIYLDRSEDAIVDLTKSIELGTRKLPEALYNRALAYEKLEQFENAYFDLQRAIELKPNFVVAENALARYSVEEVAE